MPNTIAQNLTRLANAKEAIAEAIEAKGVTLGENDGFEDFADAIGNISGGGGGAYSDVSCTMQEYKAMQSHDNHTIYTVTDSTETYKFLGDDPIGYTVVSKGYFNPGKFFDEWKWQSRDRAGGAYAVTSKQTDFNQPATGTCFDRSKAWDIVACIYLKDPMQRGTYATGALFGGAGTWTKFSGYPSAEMFSNGTMFFGISEDGTGWAKTISISKLTLDEILVAGLNYLKFSYDGTSAITLSHSRDSINYTTFHTDSINFTPTNVPNDGLNMVFTGVEAHPFPMDFDYHMVIHECKIYSEGELILGHEVLPKSVSPVPSVPEQKLTAVQGGWRPAGDTGYEYAERYDATADPITAPLRCCLPTYVYNIGGSNGQISCEGSGIMANIRDLTFNSSSGQLIVIQNNVTDWLPMPISLTNYATNTPLCITFKKTDGTQTLLPNEIGTITIS